MFQMSTQLHLCRVYKPERHFFSSQQTDHFLLLLSAVHLGVDDLAWGSVGSPGTQTRETERSKYVDMCV